MGRRIPNLGCAFFSGEDFTEEQHMNAVDKVMPPKEVDYSAPSETDHVRELIARVGLSQRAAARELEIGEREMRGYCAGDKVPRVVMLALERLVDLQRRVS
jgi:predicted ABC-type transport system involved in lysophospholipase L1 biosynthesis ATPase subunit